MIGFTIQWCSVSHFAFQFISWLIDKYVGYAGSLPKYNPVIRLLSTHCRSRTWRDPNVINR